MQSRIIKIALSNRLPDLAIPLQQFKDVLIVDHNEDDPIIERYARAAIDTVESKTKRLLSVGTVTCILKNMRNQIYLPRIPVISLTTVEIFENEAWSAFTDYSNSLDVEGIKFNKFGTFRIIYQAGYSDIDPIPEGLKNVVFTEVSYRYENRGDIAYQDGLCTEADKLITQYLNLSWI